MSRAPLVIAALALLSPLAFAAPASADTPGCVSLRELHRVDHQDAITKPQVQRIFDTRGHRTSRDGASEGRRYRTCGDFRPAYSFVNVGYYGGYYVGYFRSKDLAKRST